MLQMVCMTRFNFHFVAWKLALLVVILVETSFSSKTLCPNLCSGHGGCDVESRCHCETGWDVAPDCSLSKIKKDLCNLFIECLSAAALIQSY